MLLTLPLLLIKESQHTLIASSNGMLVKRDSTSRLAMKTWKVLGLGEKYLWQNQSYFLQYIYIGIGINLLHRRVTGSLARLYAGVLIVDIIGLKGGQLSSNCFLTLQRQ